MTVMDGSFEDRLARLRQSFIERSLGDARDLDEASARMTGAGGTVSPDEREGVRHIAHRLAGAAGTFGFPMLTDQAGKLEGVARSDCGAGELAGGAAKLAAFIRETLCADVDTATSSDTKTAATS